LDSGRYEHLAIREIESHGRRVTYRERRFLPESQSFKIRTTIRTQPEDRLDLIAAREMGNSELFWKVCDANQIINRH